MAALTTHEILRSNWTFFFTGFNRLHEGWLVTVEQLDERLGAQTIARDMAFEGIVASDGAITLMVGETPGRHISHTVRHPLHVLLDEGRVDFGFGEALEIVAADGGRTLVRFAAPRRHASFDA
jgi:hypothetical protein